MLGGRRTGMRLSFQNGRRSIRPISWGTPKWCAAAKNNQGNRQVLDIMGQYFQERFSASPFVIEFKGKKMIQAYAGQNRMLVIFATNEYLLRNPFRDCEGFSEATPADIFFALVDQLTNLPDPNVLQAIGKIKRQASLDFATSRVLHFGEYLGRKCMFGIIEIKLCTVEEMQLGFDFKKQVQRFLGEFADYYRGGK